LDAEKNLYLKVCGVVC
jgi:hypothetical protein